MKRWTKLGEHGKKIIQEKDVEMVFTLCDPCDRKEEK
jgi:hypothetical protein